MDDGIKALFLAASAIHFGLRPATGGSTREATAAHQMPADNTHPPELPFSAGLYRLIHGRCSRKHRGSSKLRQWSLMPDN